jgi:serine/threonine protein kinase
MMNNRGIPTPEDSWHLLASDSTGSGTYEDNIPAPQSPSTAQIEPISENAARKMLERLRNMSQPMPAEAQQTCFSYIIKLLNQDTLSDTIQLNSVAAFRDKLESDEELPKLFVERLSKDQNDKYYIQTLRAIKRFVKLKGYVITSTISLLMQQLLAYSHDREKLNDAFDIITLILKEQKDMLNVRKMFQYIGPYLCTPKELGRGTYAIVRRGMFKDSKGQAHEVAIKTLTTLSNIIQIKREIELMQQLTKQMMDNIQHPSIVKLLDVVLLTDTTYELLPKGPTDRVDWDRVTNKLRQGYTMHLVLEYVDGGTLKGYLEEKKGPLPETEVLMWLRSLNDGLQALRQQNIIHRDLKPANLLISKRGKTPILKISDFGLSRFLEPGSLAETYVGTPLYMAPEVLANQQHGNKADLWSVGVLLYEMLYGRVPFPAHNYQELVYKVNNQKVSFDPSIPVSQEMKALISATLIPDHNQRCSWVEFFMHVQNLLSPPRLVSSPGPSKNNMDLGGSSGVSTVPLTKYRELFEAKQAMEKEMAGLTQMVLVLKQEGVKKDSRIEELERQNEEREAAFQEYKRKQEEETKRREEEMNVLRGEYEKLRSSGRDNELTSIEAGTTDTFSSWLDRITSKLGPNQESIKRLLYEQKNLLELELRDGWKQEQEQCVAKALAEQKEALMKQHQVELEERNEDMRMAMAKVLKQRMTEERGRRKLVEEQLEKVKQELQKKQQELTETEAILKDFLGGHQ